MIDVINLFSNGFRYMNLKRLRLLALLKWIQRFIILVNRLIVAIGEIDFYSTAVQLWNLIRRYHNRVFYHMVQKNK